MKNITYKTFTYQIPFDITCTVSGAVKTYSSEDFINDKIDRFGGLPNLIATYVCRDAQRLVKAGKTVDEIKKIIAANGPIPKVSLVKAEVVKEEKVPEVKVKLDTYKPITISPMTKETASADTCYNPSFKLAGNDCSKCALKGICISAQSPKGKLKQLMKKAA